MINMLLPALETKGETRNNRLNTNTDTTVLRDPDVRLYLARFTSFPEDLCEETEECIS